MVRVILALLLFAVPVQVTRQDNESEAIGVWEKVLAAKGGKDRLQAIESVLRSSRHAQSVRGSSCRECPVEELFVFPNQFWYWSDERPTVFGLRARSVDFETKRAFSAAPRQRLPNDPLQETEYLSESVADPLKEGWRLELLQAGELLETRWMHLRPVRTWAETKGKSRSVFVECKFKMATGGATAVFILDALTFLPRRVILTEPIYSVPKPGAFTLHLDTVAHHEFEIAQYVDVDGIKMPVLLQHRGDTSWQEKVQYQFNVDYDPKVFERGPRIEDGPKGWRKQEK